MITELVEIEFFVSYQYLIANEMDSMGIFNFLKFVQSVFFQICVKLKPRSYQLSRSLQPFQFQRENNK